MGISPHRERPLRGIGITHLGGSCSERTDAHLQGSRDLVGLILGTRAYPSTGKLRIVS